ncbi:MAG: transcriptional regulator, partial [Burkholderiaceae bacterium]|nr:transcriptional regulator [Burkholderiaceae bacterium]
EGIVDVRLRQLRIVDLDALRRIVNQQPCAL